jgi:Calcineurin-like phosphoesterase
VTAIQPAREPSSFETTTFSRRPNKLDPDELGFTPRGPVAWLSPAQLAATGVRVAFAEQFGAYLDKRELQVALPTQVHDEFSAAEELWVDYVADLGDGFDATYTMAYLLAQEQIQLGNTRFPRGRVLLLGGDQVYPTASGAAYEDRFEGPYKAALPQPITDSSPSMFALPGNHDWYDGLTAYLRLFARRGGGHIGGWRTRQTRSYFALKLPHRWWLLAIDAQGEAYLDDPQLEFFKHVSQTFQPGDKVIVLTPQPAWVQTDGHPRYYDTIDYFMRAVIDPTGAEVAAMISGDLHHYARYAQTDGERQLITSGGGGAYMYATHQLPTRVVVPPKHSQVRRMSEPSTYKLAKTYPTKLRSRWLGTGVFRRLPWRNPGFTALLGVVHTMLLLALQNEGHRILSVPIFLVGSLIMASTIFFSVGLSSGQMHARPFVLGGLHGIAHIGLGVLGWMAWRELPFVDWEWPLPPIMAALIYLPIAGVAAALLVSAYLLVASNFRVNLNELFAGQGIEDYKGFLRMRFAADGSLTIYSIGVDKVSHRWVAQSEGSWFRPAKALRPRLVDEPVVFAPAGGTTPADQLLA